MTHYAKVKKLNEKDRYKGEENIRQNKSKANWIICRKKYLIWCR